MVSGFEKDREWAQAERCTETRVEPDTVLGFGTGNVALGVVEAAANDHIRLRAGAGKSEYQIAEGSHDAKIGCTRTTDWGSSKLKFVVDPVEPYSDRELGHSDSQHHNPAVTAGLTIAQLSHRDRSTTAYTQGISLLAQGWEAGDQGSQECERYNRQEPFHD